MATRAHDRGRVRWTVPAEASALGRVRRRVARWLEDSAVPPAAWDDTMLVVSELLTNAIDASAASGANVRLQLSRTPGGCRITVADQGPGFRPAPRFVPPDGGRGLVVVRSLATELNIKRQATGWTVVSALVTAPGAMADGITRPGSARSGL